MQQAAACKGGWEAFPNVIVLACIVALAWLVGGGRTTRGVDRQSRTSTELAVGCTLCSRMASPQQSLVLLYRHTCGAHRPTRFPPSAWTTQQGL